jgi:hypothetical protein
MNVNVGFLTIAVAGFLGLMASCSSDSDDGDESSAGTSSGSGGRAGAASGGSKNSGGSNASAGTSNNGGSSNPTAGNTNNGGGSNLGGTGFDPDDYACDAAPQPGSSCDSGTEPCIDGTQVCYCDTDEWACMEVGGGAGGAGPGGGLGEIECPATKPMNGGDCGDMVGFCPYGGQFMGCACLEGAWACI